MLIFFVYLGKINKKNHFIKIRNHKIAMIISFKLQTQSLDKRIKIQKTKYKIPHIYKLKLLSKKSSNILTKKDLSTNIKLSQTTKKTSQMIWDKT